MMKKIITTIILLAFLADSTGLRGFSLEPQRLSDGLRPLSMLVSGTPLEEPKSSSAGASSSIADITLDLSSEDKDEVMLLIIEKMFDWIGDGKQVCLSCTPKTENELELAQELGFEAKENEPAVDSEMVMTDDSLKTFAKVMEFKAEDIAHFIPYAQRSTIIKKDEVISRIRGLIDEARLGDAWSSINQESATLDKFSKDKDRLINALSDKDSEIKNIENTKNEKDSSVKDVCLSLSTEDLTDTNLRLADLSARVKQLKEAWYSKEKPVSLTSSAFSQEQAAMAKRLGLQATARDEVAQAVFKRTEELRVQDKRKANPTSDRHNQEVMLHTIDFGGKRVTIAGRSYRSILLVTTDNHSTNQMANAIRKNNSQPIRDMIEKGDVIPLGFELIMPKDSLSILGGALDIDQAEVGEHFITNDKRGSLIQTHQQQAKQKNEKTAKEAKKEEIVSAIRKLIKSDKLHYALQALNANTLLNEFKSDKANLILELSQRYIENNDFSKAKEMKSLLIKHFGSNPRGATVREHIQRFTKEAAEAHRRAKHNDMQAKNVKVNELLEEGRWWEAWEVAGGENLKKGGENPLCEKIKKAVRKPENVPEWLSRKECLELLRFARKAAYYEKVIHAIALKDEVPFRINEDLRKDFRAFAKRLALVDEEVFPHISNLAKAFCFSSLGADEMYFTKKDWIKTLAEFKTEVIPWIRLPDDYGDKDIRNQCKGTLQVIVAYADAIQEMYDIEDQNDGKRRLERLSGEPQEDVGSGVALIYTLFEDDESKESLRQICKRNLLAGGVRCAQMNTAVFGKEILAEYLRGFIKYKVAFPILPALGAGLYPAFALPHSFLSFGALPMLAPSELAGKLKEEYILKKEVITTSSGASAIRIFMKDAAYFDGPIYPGIPIVYLYPLRPGDRRKTVNASRAEEMLENWDETLDILSNSEWEGEKARFLAGGIDYAFESGEGLKRLIDMLMPGASEDEKSKTLKEVQATQAEARRKGCRIPGRGIRFRNEYYNMLSVLLNHWISCDYVCSKAHEKEAAAKKLAQAFSDPVFRDIRLQSSLLMALSGDPNMMSVLEDIVGDSRHAETLAKLAMKSVEAHIALRCEESKSLEAPWDILTGWDPDAPKAEAAEEIEERRILWYIAVELVADILSASIIKERFLDNILFHLDEKNNLGSIAIKVGKTLYECDTKTYPLDARCLRVLAKLGFEPFIAEPGLIDIANNARAQRSAEVVSANEKSPPCIVINLEEDWKILKDEAWGSGYLQGDEQEAVTDRLVFVLVDNNGVVMDEKEYDQYVDKEHRCLVKDLEGNSELSKVIGTYARAAIPHLLSDVNRFRSAVKALATDSKYISSKVDSILHRIPTGRRPYSLAESITGVYEQAQVDIALEKSSEHQVRFGLEDALEVITRAQQRFPDNQLLKQKYLQLDRLIRRGDVIGNASRTLSQRSRIGVDELSEAFKELVTFYSDGKPLAEAKLIEAIGTDSKGLRLYNSLKDSIEKAKIRKQLLDEAESDFAEDNLAEATAKAEDAQSKSWPGADIDKFLENVAKREDEIAGKLIEDELKEIYSLADKTDEMAPLRQLNTRLKRAEHKIEDFPEEKERAKLITQLEQIQDTISDKIDKIEADLQAKRDRISSSLSSLRGNIFSIPTTTEALKEYDIKEGPTREDLRIWGRELRSLEREITKLTTANDQPLKESLAEINDLYKDRQAKLKSLINRLKKDVTSSLAEARDVTGMSDRVKAKSTINGDFKSAQQAITTIPSTEVQHDQTQKLEKAKKYVKTAMDKEDAKEITKILDEKLKEIDAMEEVTVGAPEQSLRTRIEQIDDDELKQGLLDKFDDTAEAYRLKKLSIDQRKIREQKETAVGMWLHLIRSVSPVQMKKWLERGSRNAYRSMTEYLDSLDTEDPQTKEYVDKQRREIESMKDAKLANLVRFGNGRRRPPRRQTPEPVRRPEPEAVEPLGALEDSLSEPEGIERIQRIRPAKLEARLGRATTQKQLDTITAQAQLMMDNVVSFNLKPDQIVPERARYMAIRDAAREKRKTAPSTDDLEMMELLLSEIESAA